MKKYMKAWEDYQFHRRANWAADQLRMHTTHELKDIGISKADINRMAHHKCPWCDRGTDGSRRWL